MGHMLLVQITALVGTFIYSDIRDVSNYDQIIFPNNLTSLHICQGPYIELYL